MSDPLYAKDLLRLAAAANGAGRLQAFDAAGSAYNPACGDRVAVTLRMDPDGRILEMAHETSACVLAQASASLLGAHLTGANENSVRRLREDVGAMLRDGRPVPAPPFAGYSALEGAAPYRNRHTCVLLPIDAVLNAMDAAQDKN
jgi:NifU-like protein involved in Fe-S cluster formation